MQRDNIHIVATGEAWVGSGIRSFASMIKEVIEECRNSLSLTIYTISDEEIVRSIKNALERGVSVEIFVYYPNDSTANESTKNIFALEKDYNNLLLHRISDKLLHAKVIVADGKRFITGSANATFSGMVTNYELGLLIEDRKVAYRILDLLRRISQP